MVSMGVSCPCCLFAAGLPQFLAVGEGDLSNIESHFIEIQPEQEAAGQMEVVM